MSYVDVGNIQDELGNSNSFQYFFVNRLSYVIYHDVFYYKIAKKEQLFPDLAKTDVLKYLWNICIFVILQAVPYSKGKRESIYISMYYKLSTQLVDIRGQDEISKAIIAELEKNKPETWKEEQSYRNDIYKNDECKPKYKNQRIKWLVNYQWNDGTLLHCATKHGLVYYCDVLMHDGSNCLVQSGPSQFDTPLTIAHKFNDPLMAKTLLKHVNTDHLGWYGKSQLERALLIEDDTNELNSNSSNNANDKAIESEYDQFVNAKEFAKYFLFSFGFDLINSKEREKHEITDKVFMEKHGFASERIWGTAKDDLYINFSDCHGIKRNDGTNISVSDCQTTMNSIVQTVELLLRKKMVVCDDILILVFEYVNMLSEYYNNDKLLNNLTNLLSQILNQCLDTGLIDNANGDGLEEAKECKAFYYQWFKSFLLSSNIWICRLNTSNDNEMLYYEIARKVVDKASVKQQQYIADCIESESKQDNSAWQQLMHYEERINPKYSDLRQDSMKDLSCIKFEDDFNLSDVYISLPLMEKGSNVDYFTEYNTKIYITKCILFASKMNDSFQNDVRDMLRQIKKEHLNTDPNNPLTYTFSKAPVKLQNRSV